VFASTCSNYGKSSDADAFVTEASELKPVSLYARTKVAVEAALLEGDRGRCAPTCLRFSTVYGLSPRPRFDLTVNEFTRDLALGRELVVFGEQFWRPYCHVRDLARSVVTVLEADAGAVGFDVFNVGDSDENYRKETIVELIRAQIPDARVRYVARDDDPRDYRVAFDKIRERLGFAITRRVPDGIREIRRAVQEGFYLDPDHPSYGNVPAAPHGR
jgi:nucleoside-diphosphate-sugar epimerase